MALREGRREREKEVNNEQGMLNDEVKRMFRLKGKRKVLKK
jgi:hypothetical protein